MQKLITLVAAAATLSAAPLSTWLPGCLRRRLSECLRDTGTHPWRAGGHQCEMPVTFGRRIVGSTSGLVDEYPKPRRAQDPGPTPLSSASPPSMTSTGFFDVW